MKKRQKQEWIKMQKENSKSKWNIQQISKYWSVINDELSEDFKFNENNIRYYCILIMREQKVIRSD